MNLFPLKFQNRIKSILPEEEWELFFERCVEPLPKVVRGSDRLKDKEVLDLRPTVIDGAYFIDRAEGDEVVLGKTMEHFVGDIYMQSLSSMLPVEVLAVEGGDKVLDMCAAPGSKSTFLSQKMDNTGVLVCNELSSSRSKKLVANINRLGVCNAVVTQSDGTFMNKFFDHHQ